jgi:hypothetical protein
MSQVLDFSAISHSIHLPDRKPPVAPLADEDPTLIANNAPSRVLAEAAFVLGAIAALILAIGVLVPG